jgi:hypothetical protein
MVRGRDGAQAHVDNDVRENTLMMHNFWVLIFCADVPVLDLESSNTFGNKAAPLLDITRIIFQF